VFESAVPFYARYRAGYPAELFDFLVDRLGLTAGDRVLDIGCGPGLASIPLARRVGQVIAIDPLPGMLADGRGAAERAGVTNIDWRRGDSATLSEMDVAGARLAVFALSFHWVDRPAVLRTLDRLLGPDGAAVVINDALGEDGQPDWADAIKEIRIRYLGPRPRPDQPWESHRAVLEASPFPEVETARFSWSRELSVNEVVGLQFSFSISEPARFGDRADAFAADVRAAVLALHPSGTVTEPNAVDVHIARRSK
jgi:SAM-dependent methyltransferase